MLRRNGRLTVGIASAALLIGTTDAANAAHRQVFLLGGQSNMVGGGSVNLPVALPFVEPLADVRFNFGNPPAMTPLTPNAWIDLAPGSGGAFGPELSFGHTLHGLDPDGDYALIKHARGGSNVSVDWNPNVFGNVYAGFRDTVDSALAALTDAGDTYEIVGMLWTQGIRDGKDGSTADVFQANLERLIADVRQRYQPDMPFFLSRLSINMTGAGTGRPGGGRDQTLSGLEQIRLGQANVAANDPLAFMIDTDAFGIGDPSHFNTSGLIDVGKAFATDYFQRFVVPEPGTAQLALAVLLLSRGHIRARRRTDN